MTEALEMNVEEQGEHALSESSLRYDRRFAELSDDLMALVAGGDSVVCWS